MILVKRFQSLMPVLTVFALLLGAGFAEAEMRRGAEPAFPFAETLQGHVVVESFGQVIAVSVDTFDASTLPDGRADRVFFFETGESFDPLSVRSMAFVDPDKKSLAIRFGDQPSLVLQLSGATAADAAATVIGGGFGYIETSRYQGERLDQVAAMARADEMSVVPPKHRAGLEWIRGQDNQPSVPPSCSTSCSTECGDGSSCTANCTSNCGSCSCGTNGASCSCS